MPRDYDKRTIPSGTDDAGTTTNRIHEIRWDDNARGKTGIRVQGFVQVGHPLQFLQATTVTSGGVTAAGFYPNDATSITSAGANAAAGAASTITLASGAPDWDITGWSILILSGPAQGDVRQVIAYNTGTRVATVDAPWSATPTTSSVYTIGLDTLGGSWVVVKAECEGNSTQSPTIQVVPFYLDYPRNPPSSGGDQGRLGVGTNVRQARVSAGAPLDMDNLNIQANTETASYYQMRERADQCMGASLTKFYLNVVPASSKHCTLYAGLV